jgi:hypothetical protein
VRGAIGFGTVVGGRALASARPLVRTDLGYEAGEHGLTGARVAVVGRRYTPNPFVGHSKESGQCPSTSRDAGDQEVASGLYRAYNRRTIRDCV